MRLFEEWMVVKQELSPVLKSAIGPDQFAYKEWCNTILAHLTCHHHWLKWFDRATDFVRVFSFDFSKAFDSVPHAIACNKLMSFKINPYVINWIVSFLSSRKQRVVVDARYCPWAHIVLYYGKRHKTGLSGEQSIAQIYRRTYTKRTCVCTSRSLFH